MEHDSRAAATFVEDLEETWRCGNNWNTATDQQRHAIPVPNTTCETFPPSLALFLTPLIDFVIDPSTLARLQRPPRLIHLECQGTWSSRRGPSCIAPPPLKPRYRKLPLPGHNHQLRWSPLYTLKNRLSLPVQLQYTQLAVIIST